MTNRANVAARNPPHGARLPPARRTRRRRRRRRIGGNAFQPWRSPAAYDDESYEWSYSSLETHRLMLHDDIRNRAYRDALHAIVRPGDVVLDFGAGTGILSMFAAQAGAARVYAVERTIIVRLTRRLVKRNGFADRIVVIRGDMENVNLPENVDVIVSEWLGTFGVDENMLAPLVLARDRWLKTGGRMVPATVTAWIAPVWNDELNLDMTLRSGRPYELDLSLVAEQDPDAVSWSWHTLAPDALAAEPAVLWTTDARTVSAQQASSPFTAELTLTADKDCCINALTTWFSADFENGVVLTNAPTSPVTHWGQYVFPLNKPVSLVKGSSLDVAFACTPAGPGYSTYTWSVRLGDGPWEHHDSSAFRTV